MKSLLYILIVPAVLLFFAGLYTASVICWGIWITFMLIETKGYSSNGTRR